MSWRRFPLVLLAFSSAIKSVHALSLSHHSSWPSPAPAKTTRVTSDIPDKVNANLSTQSTRRRECLLQGLAATGVIPLSWLAAFPDAARASSPPSGDGGGRRRDASPDPDLSAAAQRLFDLDAPNRLIPGRDYAIDVQGGERPSALAREDAAPAPLFRYVDPSVFDRRPTYRVFAALLDNYDAEVCATEDVTEGERAEGYAFLREAMATPTMKFCYWYCRSRMPAEKAPESEEAFIEILHRIWFKLYRRCDADVEDGRDRIKGSSGFEHVFVGEIRDGKVVGFHSWIQIYLQERANNVDYRGAISAAGTPLPSSDARVLTYQLRWNGFDKYVGTSLIGVSPEFELALYTMCFLVGGQDNVVLLETDTGRIKLDVKCYRIANGKVGTCFVESIPS